MRRSTQHEADERIARYLTRLADHTAGRKAQYFVDEIASAWGPELRSCFGHTKWHVTPTASGVVTVAAEAVLARPVRLRIAALSALAHTGEHAPLAEDVVKDGLADSDAGVRLAAARTAAETRMGDVLGRELRVALSDDVWAVRWHAARGLVARAYDAELGTIAHTLVASTPRGGMSLTAWAHAVEAVRPRCRVAGQNTELDTHVTRTFAALSARDRDFAWPLWR